MRAHFVLASVCAFTTACVSEGQFDKVSGENLYLGRQVQSQQQEIDRLRNELNLMRTISDTHQEVESISGRWIGDLEAKVKELEGLKFSVNDRGEGTVQIANTLLFNPGEITVSTQGRKSLTTLAVQLKTAPGLLRIDGHTDDQPIKNASTLSHSKDNWQLSCNRSLAVLRVLLESGVSPEKISVAGYGMYRPVEQNSKKGSSANRRVDIVFLPEVPTESQVPPEPFKNVDKAPASGVADQDAGTVQPESSDENKDMTQTE